MCDGREVLHQCVMEMESEGSVVQRASGLGTSEYGNRSPESLVSGHMPPFLHGAILWAELKRDSNHLLCVYLEVSAVVANGLSPTPTSAYKF